MKYTGFKRFSESALFMTNSPQPTPSDQDITALLPHRGQMLLIDRLTYAVNPTAHGEKTFTADHPLAHDGRVPRALLVEVMAQTLAALAGVEAGDRPAAPGMLAGVEHATFHDDPRTGIVCVSEVTFTRRLGPFHFAQGRVTQEGRLLAEAQMRFFIAEADHATPSTARSHPTVS